MARIDEILEQRREDRRYDDSLWSFMNQVDGRNLINLTDKELQDRLDSIDRNIQYLDSGSTARDGLGPERGWLSPWWWLRARHWTLMEFEQRNCSPAATAEIPAMPLIAESLNGVVSGGRKLLVRISQLHWLMETINKGMLRFAPATLYRDLEFNAARSDDELIKTYQRPGQVLQITSPDGSKIKTIGDVAFSMRRGVGNGISIIDVPYWMCSFSSDFDPRLFKDFASAEPEKDACIIIFEPETLVQRALSPLKEVAPLTIKSMFPTDYFDPFYPFLREISALKSKDFRYAYQREMRFVLDPEMGAPLGAGGPLFVQIGSISDIAGVYNSNGQKVAGVGPDSFFA